jgi:serpin B
MGMPLAFSDSADFSGMTASEAVHIAAVLHKAFVAVDEEGTEAAAATAIILEKEADDKPLEPKEFRADHPFLFLIRDVRSDAILFMGRVSNPAK